MTATLLAGDIGGTRTRLGLFAQAAPRPEPIVVHEFGTLDFPDLKTMIAAFLRDKEIADRHPDRACFGVAGPVADNAATLTNVPWRVDAREIERESGISRVHLLNDLQALATSVPVLTRTELHVLQEGRAVEDANIALIAAGTGLGEALLIRIDGRVMPSASEGGHADFPARNEREFTLARDLIARFGRAEVEHVLAGHGFVNLHRVTHREPCRAAIDLNDPHAPAAISAAGLERRCPGCEAALEMFVEAYGAEAGNLALRAVATGGVFVGGGIAPKILAALTRGAFMRAFVSKAPFEAMLQKIPVKVILNEQAGLIGAAVHAQRGDTKEQH